MGDYVRHILPEQIRLQIIGNLYSEKCNFLICSLFLPILLLFKSVYLIWDALHSIENLASWVFLFPAKRVEVPAALRRSWRNHNWTCGYFECIFWKAVTCYALPTCCLRCLKDPSHSTTQHRKLDVRQIIFDKYCKIISLNDVKTSKNLRGWEKLLTFSRHKTLKSVNCLHFDSNMMLVAWISS